jgi:hypothetical protein
MGVQRFAGLVAVTILAACGPQDQFRGGDAGVVGNNASHASNDSGGVRPDGGSADAAASSLPLSCGGPDDCWVGSPDVNGPSCCVSGLCAYTMPPACTGPDAGVIKASNYDQSCSSDSDCVPIVEGNACDTLIDCATGAIRRDAQAQYEADILGICSPHLSAPLCTGPSACCVNSVCQLGSCNPGADQ